MKQHHPIVVRPRKGSELERIWLDCKRDMAAMRELIHRWAESKGENK